MPKTFPHRFYQLVIGVIVFSVGLSNALAVDLPPTPVVPVIAGGFHHSLVIKPDGTLWGWG